MNTIVAKNLLKIKYQTQCLVDVLMEANRVSLKVVKVSKSLKVHTPPTPPHQTRSPLGVKNL